MSAGKIRAGEAFIEISEDHSKLEAGLKKIQQRMQSVSAAFRSAGAKLFGIGDVAIGGLLAASRVFADMGAGLKLMSMRTGIAVKDLSALNYVAQRFGVDAGEIEQPIRKMQKSIAGAAQGSREANHAFGLLGVSVGQLVGKTADQQIGILGDQFEKIQDPTEKAAIAMELFGKNGTAMLPLLDLGSKGMAQWVQHGRDVGAVLGDDAEKMATLALRLKQATDDVWAGIKRVVFEVGGALAPALIRITGVVSGWLKKAADWIHNNKGLVVGVALAAFAVAGLGVALIGLGLALPAIAALFSIVGSIAGLLTSPVGLGFVAGLVGIGIAAGVVAALVYENWDKIKALTARIWKSIKAEVMGALDGIKNAFEAGDIILAVKIMWTTIELLSVQAASEMWKPLLNSFFNVKNSIEDEWRSMLAAMNLGSELTGPQKVARAAAQSKTAAGLQLNGKIAELQKQLDDLEKQAKKEVKDKKELDKKKEEGDGAGFGSRSTAGLFNATAAFGLGGGGTVDRIATATEETAKNTRPIKAAAKPAAGAIHPAVHAKATPGGYDALRTKLGDAVLGPDGNYHIKSGSVEATLTPDQYANLRDAEKPGSGAQFRRPAGASSGKAAIPWRLIADTDPYKGIDKSLRAALDAGHNRLDKDRRDFPGMTPWDDAGSGKLDLGKKIDTTNDLLQKVVNKKGGMFE